MSDSKESIQETRVQSLGWEDPLEKEMATGSSIIIWEIPWTEEPSRLQSMGSRRVGHNLVTKQQYYAADYFPTIIIIRTVFQHGKLFMENALSQ